MKATEHFSPVVLFIVLYKLVEPVYDFTEFLPFKSKILSSPFLLCLSELAILFSLNCFVLVSSIAKVDIIFYL